VKILKGKEILTASLYPFLFAQSLAFWAVLVPARVVPYPDVPTVVIVALIPMPAKRRGPTVLNGFHGPSLIIGQPMSLSVRRAVLAKDIRHFDAMRRPHQRFDERL
jgi:hypothetical protein